MSSFSLNYILKALALNVVIWVVGTSTYEFGGAGGNTILSKALDF